MAMASISTSRSLRQIRAWIPVLAGRDPTQRAEELVADRVELRVVALDVADVAGGADDVVPGRAFVSRSPVMLW